MTQTQLTLTVINGILLRTTNFLLFLLHSRIKSLNCGRTSTKNSFKPRRIARKRGQIMESLWAKPATKKYIDVGYNGKAFGGG